MTLTLIGLTGSALVIYLCCEGFTNGVEWLGLRLRLGQTATGTVLAALGTALPEGVVTLVATAFASDPSQQDIGIGAALGGPLALAGVAYAVVGLTLLRLGRAPALVVAARRRLVGDQRAFLVIFAVKLGLGLALFHGKGWFGLLFLAAYGGYLTLEMRRPKDHATAEELAPLMLRPRQANPGLGWIALQCLLAAGLTFVASRLFVTSLDRLAPALGLAPQLVALFIAPIATELPETLNAVIWVRQGKDRLALANISGSMMVQATIPTAFGLFFTPWRLDHALLLAGGATALAMLYLILLFRRPVLRPLALAQVAWTLPLLLVALLLV